MFASLFQFSNNSRGKPACLFFILRKVPSVLPYSLTLSRRVTTKWYRGKCAPLSASENGGSIILSAHEWLRNIRKHIPQPTVGWLAAFPRHYLAVPARLHFELRYSLDCLPVELAKLHFELRCLLVEIVCLAFGGAPL